MFGKISPSKWSNIEIHKNDRVEIVVSCGAGWGSPLDRDPALVLSDVISEFVSVRGVRDHYGVVIDPASMAVDQSMTSRSREEMKISGPKINPGKGHKTLLTSILRLKSEFMANNLSSNQSIISYTQLPENRVLMKVQGSDYQTAHDALRDVAKKLNVDNPSVLTVQFVPDNFVEP